MCVFVVASLLTTLHQLKELDGISKPALQRMKITLIIILFIPLSRCTLSFQTATTSTSSATDPGTITDKVFFYFLQLLPEVTACLITAFTDYKTLCDVGKWGDYPRRRMEEGKPEYPGWFTIFARLFTPWQWQRLLVQYIVTRQAKRAQENPLDHRLQEYGLKSVPYEDRRTLLITPNSSGWQSSVELTNLGKSDGWSEIDAEKPRHILEWPVSSNNPSGSSSSQASTIGTMTSKVSHSSQKSSLISDVKLWTPRLPAAFSFDADGR